MIYLVAPGTSKEAATLVYSAIERSCGYGQVQLVSINKWKSLREESAKILSVFINPLDEWASEILRAFQRPEDKTLLLGKLPIILATYFNAKTENISGAQFLAAQCACAPMYGQANSDLCIRYNDIKGFSSPISCRSFLRYDFSNEWNNLGFGAVFTDCSIWALSQIVKLPQTHVLANLTLENTELGAYAGAWLKDSYVKGATLWFNRAVGPIDSQEWRVVEQFFSSVGFPECACLPVLLEIPYGYDSAVTMRLDCDEDVESARPISKLYKTMQIPFSLALHTRVLEDPRHHVLPRDVIRDGGAILSHTATHATNWGGSYENAYKEGLVSATAIAEVTGYRVRYAVSPFHQTPTYARSGLADAGYHGCIGGIIKNDYDFLMARSGVPPFSSRGFIGHTQQCMLHGDCMLTGADPIVIYKKAFELAKASGTFFGYLDHPFSDRYQYGWSSEAQRLHVHMLFIEYMKKTGNVLFVNENDAMNYLHDRASIVIERVREKLLFKLPSNCKSHYSQSFEYGYEIFILDNEMTSL